MLDPLTALGLAASIIQFVDVGYRIVTGTAKAYADGSAISEQGELELIIEDIKAANSQLASNSAGLSKNEKALRSLAKTCEDIAAELDSMLEKLHVPDNSKFKLMKSFQVSVGAARKGKDIQALKQRLFDIQSHVQQRVAAIAASNQISGLKSDVQALHGQHDKIGIATHTKLDHLITEIRKLAEGMQNQPADQHQHLTDLADRINNTIVLAKQARRNEQIIETLWFHMLKDRHDSIVTAYDHTLKWLFDPGKTSLYNWLRSGSGIYWVNGLVGLAILLCITN